MDNDDLVKAHDKEVYDIAFACGTEVFASVGADGSVRLFDLRCWCTQSPHSDLTAWLAGAWNTLQSFMKAQLHLMRPLCSVWLGTNKFAMTLFHGIILTNVSGYELSCHLHDGQYISGYFGHPVSLVYKFSGCTDVFASEFLRSLSRSSKDMSRVSTLSRGHRIPTATSAQVPRLFVGGCISDSDAAGDDAHALIWDLQALPRAIEGGNSL